MNCELSDPGSSLSRQQNQLTPIFPNNWETEKNLQRDLGEKNPNPNGGKCVLLEKHTSQKDSGEEIGRPFGPPLPRRQRGLRTLLTLRWRGGKDLMHS